MATPPPLKVLVVDDTAIFRKIISDAVASFPDVQVTGTAPSGQLALQRMEQNAVDLVLLDVHMPEMDGVETLSRIRERFPSTDVILISGSTTRQTTPTIKALQMGALEFIRKPESATMAESILQLKDHLKPVLRMIEIRRLTRRITGEGNPVASERIQPVTPATRTAPSGSKPARFNLVVIGVSTGGPNALALLMPQLPKNFNVPVLIVQHMPPVFTASLAEHLSRISPLAVREAKDGEVLAPGSALIAPGGRHLTLKKATASAGRCWMTVIHDGPPVNSCRPSVDVLFSSVAQVNPGGVLAVILTGMGEDGAAGIADLKHGDCWCLAQNEASCVVYGMPRAVVDRNLADEILPLEILGNRITELIQKK